MHTLHIRRELFIGIKNPPVKRVFAYLLFRPAVGREVLQTLVVAMCRRTRQIVAYAIGDRSETTAQKLWQAIPEAYRACPMYTDEYNVYPLIIPPEQHRPAPKDAHQTNHQERWNNTLRQWLGRYTRKSLSFSRQDAYHSLVTHWFIILHNLTIRSSLTF
jgi:insertion element IS1 protein InsB